LKRRADKFPPIGYAGNPAPDHVDQLHSLPTYLKWLIVPVKPSPARCPTIDRIGRLNRQVRLDIWPGEAHRAPVSARSDVKRGSTAPQAVWKDGA
jgi:hypothetical protein